MGKNKPILTIGPVFCDLLLQGYQQMPAKGEELYLKGYTVSLGGNAIVASALAQLNVPTSLLTTVGDDILGEYLIALMKEKGIGQEHVIRLSQTQTNVSFIFTQDGDRSFLTWLQEHERYLKEVQTRLASMQASLFSHIHICFELLGLPFIQEFLKAGRAAGVPISTDLGFQDAQSWDDESYAHLALVDYFFPNIDEAKLITGSPELVQMLQKLAQYVQQPIITLGEKGVAALSKEHGVVFVPAPSVVVCNTTGAGDSFVAGFLYGRYHSMSLLESLQAGVVTGSLTAASFHSVSPEISEGALHSKGVIHG
ncbi:MAG TPA: carbohydrate kinase family protein [Sphaerochaeta sp.]|nr:carbohydrate kinase family protein [Sphaerochaeta sp.]